MLVWVNCAIVFMPKDFLDSCGKVSCRVWSLHPQTHLADQSCQKCLVMVTDPEGRLSDEKAPRCTFEYITHHMHWLAFTHPKKKKTPLTSSPQVVWEENTWNWASDVTNAPKCTCFEPTSSKPLSSFLKAVERRKAEGVRQRRYWHHLMKEQENIKSLVKKMHRNNTSWHWAPIHFYCSSRGDLIGLVTTAVEPMYETCFFYDYPI